MTKNDIQKMNTEIIPAVEKILDSLYGKRETHWKIYCGCPEDMTIRLTDWNYQYHGLRKGKPYIYIWCVEDDCLLYAIDVNGTSTKWALAQLFELIGDKY